MQHVATRENEVFRPATPESVRLPARLPACMLADYRGFCEGHVLCAGGTALLARVRSLPAAAVPSMDQSLRMTPCCFACFACFAFRLLTSCLVAFLYVCS